MQSETATKGWAVDKRRLLRPALCIFLALTAFLSLETGAAGVRLTGALASVLSGVALSPMEQVVLWDIRMPRLLTGVLVGAGLAVAGAILQGLFRNPLADPGIVGVNAGAGLGAILAIVMGAALPGPVRNIIGVYLVPLSAFVFAWGTVALLTAVATRRGQTSVATMLLAGIALAALAFALSGVLINMADDQQLRDLTFWNLGSLAGASWAKVFAASPLIIGALLVALSLGKGLNGLALGEATAVHIGIDVQWLKRLAILCVAGAAGAAVAVSGGIGFVGIVVPHLLRLVSGPDHRALLGNSALLGASLLLLADLLARTIIAPAELPIGIVTSLIGAPFFLWILLRKRGLVDL